MRVSEGASVHHCCMASSCTDNMLCEASFTLLLVFGRNNIVQQSVVIMLTSANLKDTSSW